MLGARELRGGRNLEGADEQKFSNFVGGLAFQFCSRSERQWPPHPAIRENQEREQSDAR